MNMETIKQAFTQVKPDARSKYLNRLERLPPTGAGYHPSILGVANLGIHAGFLDEEIFESIREHTNERARSVPDSEIWNAIEKARGDSGSFSEKTRTKSAQPQINLPYTLPVMKRRLIEAGKRHTEQDLLSSSSMKLGGHPFEDALCLLDTFYAPHEHLFIGTRFHKEPCTIADFKEFILADQDTSKLPHIIPNPLTGDTHKTKDDKPSMRCDTAIKEYRFVVAEFDNIPREEQLAFWSAIPLPIAALIDSGGKSIHAWIKLSEVYTPEHWQQIVKDTLYAQMLIPMGCDPACSNPARLSRLPGHYREEKGRWQRLLYINQNPSPKGIFRDS